MKCRHCHAEVTLPFIDLGSAPPSNAYLDKQHLQAPEQWFPLRVFVCDQCWLVQTEDFAEAEELFDPEYAYFSGISTSWLQHCKQYVDNMIKRFNLNGNHHVIEIAANDGYLLQYVKARHIPCTGIEPTASTANAARAKEIPIVEDFFGIALAKKLINEHKQADLMIANNVLAHVPDINDFVSGFSLLLKENGVATFEFPHLLKLVEQNQFDTIYHEHFSYLSFSTVNTIFLKNGLSIFDVEELPTHGGSLRVYAQRKDTGKHPCSPEVTKLLQKEKKAGIFTKAFYLNFQTKADKVKTDFLSFLLSCKNAGKTVAGYGAAAKGNTLMNYASVDSNLIQFVADRNVAKQGKMLPGCRIPIYDETQLKETKPDYIVIFPWNLKTEIIQQLNYANKWNAKFVTVIPQLEII